MTVEPTDLTAYLESLAAVGTHAGQGAFSVDLRKSVAKLTDFRLRDPGNFGRHLFSAAVALKASQVRIQTRTFYWTIEIHCDSLSFAEMTEIFPSLTFRQAGPRGMGLQELAMMLTHLRGYIDVNIRLSSGPARLDLMPHVLHVHPSVNKQPQVGIKIEVQSLGWMERLTTPGLPFKMWWLRTMPRLPLAELQNISRMAPLARWLNSKEWPADRKWDIRTALRLQGQAILPFVESSRALTLDLRHDEEFSLLIRLWPEELPKDPVTIVNWGLCFDQPDPWMLLPIHAVIASDSLNRDLMGVQIVQDEEWSQISEVLHRQVLRLMGKILIDRRGQTGPLLVELCQAWAAGRFETTLHDDWNDLAFLRPGGWARRYSPRELTAMVQRQGFLHLDPKLQEEETRKTLELKFPVRVECTPYQALKMAPEGIKWLLQVPVTNGEVRFRDCWPLPAARVLVGEKEVHQPETAQLPAGLEISLNTMGTSSLWSNHIESLGKVFLAILSHQPDRYASSAPGLALALWMRASNHASAGKFALKVQPSGSILLDKVLVSNQLYYVTPEDAQASDFLPWNDRTVVILGRPQFDLLVSWKPGLREVLSQLDLEGSDFSLGLRAALSFTDGARVVIAQAAEAIAAEDGCLLRYPEGGGRNKTETFVVGLKMTQFERCNYREKNDVTLSSFLAQKVETLERPWVSRVSRFNQRGPDISSIYAYVVVPVKLDDGEFGLVYLERRIRDALFSAEDSVKAGQVVSAGMTRLLQWSSEKRDRDQLAG